jgi:HD superfamily phosphohydrolase
MRIRDPVHNFVSLPEELKPILDSPALQRLRRIRQLALASLVYPGALHSRFDHTLGVAHVAGMMAASLRLNEEEKRLIYLAALLHDVGHGPFSHVSEASLVRFADKSTLKEGQNPAKIHELVTAEIIRTDPTLQRAMGCDERQNVIQLLDEGYGRRVLKQIISGPIDADKQDYLLRDSKFCGVEYGIFDLHQLHRSLVLLGDAGSEEIVVDEDGVHPAEQFMLAKYYMTANVYRHRVRLITDQMIGRAIHLGVERDAVEPMKHLFSFDNTDAFIANYQLWDDSRFMETFCPLHADPPGRLSGMLLRRLRERQLLKEVYSERVEGLDGRFREMVGDISKPRYDRLRVAIETEVGDFLEMKLGTKCTSGFVIAHSFTIKSVRESSRNEENQVLVRCGDRPRYFTDESKLLGSINEAFSDDLFKIYAPIKWPDPIKRDELRQSWKPQIRELVEKQCGIERGNSRSESQ